MTLAQIARKQKPRRTGRTMAEFERQLFCIRCDTLIAVFEAPAGFLDPLEFVCRWCQGLV